MLIISMLHKMSFYIMLYVSTLSYLRNFSKKLNVIDFGIKVF